MNYLVKYIFAFVVFIASMATVYAEEYTQDMRILQEYYLHKNKIRPPEEINKIQGVIEKHKDDLEFNYSLGIFFFDIKSFIDAEVIFKKLYETHPKDKYEISYGMALLEQEKSNDILQFVKLNGLSDALTAQKYFLHASAYNLLERHKTALKLINTAIDMDKTKVKFFLLKARLLTKIKKINESMVLLQFIAKMNKSAVDKVNPLEIDVLRAKNYLEVEQYPEALAIYNAALKKEPHNISIYAERGLLHLKMQNFDDAFNDGLFIAKNDVGNDYAVFIIASVLNHQKRYTKALEIYEGMSLESYLPNLLLSAEINFKTQKYETALILLNKYLRNDFKNAQALKLRAILKLKQGNTRDALGDLEIAYGLNKQDPDIFMALAYGYYHLQKYKKVALIYHALKNNFPKFKDISNVAFDLSCKLEGLNKGTKNKHCKNPIKAEISEEIFKILQFMYLGYHREALKEIKNLKKIYPDNHIVTDNYIRILKYTDNTNKAVAILLKMLDKSVDSEPILSELNQIHQSKKSNTDIISALEKIYLKNPESVNLGYHLADMYYDNKNYTKAFEIANNTIKIKSTHSKIKDLHEVILKVMLHNSEKFSQEIISHLKKYISLENTDNQFIRFLRKNIIQINFKNPNLNILDVPLGEKSARDYQIYAEYLSFVNKHPQAKDIYQKSTQEFTNDFELFNSASDYYKNSADLTHLKNIFTSTDNNYHKILQAKLYIAQGQKEKAADLLRKQFKADYHGAVANVLLTLDTNKESISLIKDNLKNIKKDTYKAHYQLAKVLYKKYRFNEAYNLLVPFFTAKYHHIEYKILLERTSFYANYPMANRLMKYLIIEYPNRSDILIDYIAYQVKNKDYKNAIDLFKTHKPHQDTYPNIHYYYANALLETGETEQGLKILKELKAHKDTLFEHKEIENLILKYSKKSKQ